VLGAGDVCCSDPDYLVLRPLKGRNVAWMIPHRALSTGASERQRPHGRSDL
jgi:hypothetical protein